MKLASILRAVVAATVLFTAFANAMDTTLSEVLELFLQGGGWALTSGEPFVILSLFKSAHASNDEAWPPSKNYEHLHNRMRQQIHAKAMHNMKHHHKKELQKDHENGYQVIFIDEWENSELEGSHDGVIMPISHDHAEPTCLDDGGDHNEGFKLSACGSRLSHQLFKFNTTSYEIQSVRKPGWCVSDAGAAQGLALAPCGSGQTFMYNFFSYQWLTGSSAASEPLCIDDGGFDAYSQPTTIGVRPCATIGNPSQTYMILPSPTSELPNLSLNESPLLAIQFPVRLRLFSSFLCVTDRGANGVLGTEPCTFTPDAAQTFAYVRATKQLKSVAKPWLCLSSSTAHATLHHCDESSASQKFTYVEGTGSIKSASDPSQCLDASDNSALVMSSCQDKDYTQFFDIEAVAPLPPLQTENSD